MFKCSQMFSDNMVLQRDKVIAVWGTGDDGELISAVIGDHKAECVIKNGKWRCFLPPMQAEDGLTLIVSNGKYSKRFTDVAIGEVWLLGGQSNMELELQNSKDGAEYLSKLDQGVPIRYYYMPKVASAEEADAQGEHTAWTKAGSDSSRNWSAVGFHFANKLSKELGVVVGLIGCNWGGSSASCWVDRSVLETDRRLYPYILEYDQGIADKSLEQQRAEYDEYVEYDTDWFIRSQEIMSKEPDITWQELEKRLGKNKWPGPKNSFNPFRPANMYENMLMRACPYTIKGFLYYQGESDDHKPESYYTLLTALISKWREKWGDDTLPFIMVQLPMFQYAGEEDKKHWCKIRSAQMKAFRTVKNTGIAVILDCGEFNEIHPKDKLPVGERLCLQAEKLFYGMDDVEAFGPMFKNCVFHGVTAEVNFDYCFDFKSNGKITGFELAGEDGVFHEASAILGGGQALVTCKQVTKPTAVRYQWTNYAEVTVFGSNGLPMAPFSTVDEV